MARKYMVTFLWHDKKGEPHTGEMRGYSDTVDEANEQARWFLREGYWTIDEMPPEGTQPTWTVTEVEVDE